MAKITVYIRNMRYLLAFLLIFISFSVNAQNRFPSVDSAKNYVLRYVKNSAVETFTNWRAQNVTYGTLELLDSLASDPAVDSIWKTNDTLKYSKGGVNYTIGTVGGNAVDSIFLQNDTLKYRINATNYSVGYVGDDTATVVKAYVTNAEAVTITKGQVVYIFGAQGDRAAVKLAKNTSDTFSSKTLGIVRADIAAGQAGWVTTQGQVSGINLGAYTAGDILWLDSVPGGFTNVKPVAPLHGVFVGVVERANPGNGLIYVKPQNGQELGELHDVKITSPTNNQVLSYTASTGIWENKSVTTAWGYTPLNVSDTAAMLTPYLRKIDTASLSSRINLRVRYSDTASMLNPYLRKTDTLILAKVSSASTTVRSKYQEICEFVPLNTFAGEVPIGGCSFTDGGAITSVSAATESGVYGIINLTTTTIGTQMGYIIHPTADLLLDSDTMKQEFRFKINNLSDSTGGTSVYNMYVGNTANVNTSAITNGFGILYNRAAANFTGANGNLVWQLFSASGGTRTFVNSTVDVTTGWHRATLISTSSKIIGYIDDIYIGEITNNIPTAAMHPIFNIRNVSGTIRTIGVDFYSADKNYNTLR